MVGARLARDKAREPSQWEHVRRVAGDVERLDVETEVVTRAHGNQLYGDESGTLYGGTAIKLFLSQIIVI